MKDKRQNTSDVVDQCWSRFCLYLPKVGSWCWKHHEENWKKIFHDIRFQAEKIDSCVPCAFLSTPASGVFGGLSRSARSPTTNALENPCTVKRSPLKTTPACYARILRLPLHICPEPFGVDSQEGSRRPRLVAGSPLLRGTPKIHVRLERLFYAKNLVVLGGHAAKNSFPGLEKSSWGRARRYADKRERRGGFLLDSLCDTQDVHV